MRCVIVVVSGCAAVTALTGCSRSTPVREAWGQDAVTVAARVGVCSGATPERDATSATCSADHTTVRVVTAADRAAQATWVMNTQWATSLGADPVCMVVAPGFAVSSTSKRALTVAVGDLTRFAKHYDGVVTDC